MTRLSKGEQKPCDRCKNEIDADELAVLVWGHWLCEACWKLWGKLRAKTVQEALTKFMEETNA